MCAKITVGKTLAERLQYFREKHLQMHKRDFSDSLGINQSQYVRIEKGEVGFAIDKMQQAVKLYGINLHWLITGQGSMQAPTTDPSTLPDDIKTFVGAWLSARKPLRSIDAKAAKEILNILEKQKIL